MFKLTVPFHLLYRKHNKPNCDMKTKVHFVNHSTLIVSVKTIGIDTERKLSHYIFTHYTAAVAIIASTLHWLFLSDSVVIVKLVCLQQQLCYCEWRWIPPYMKRGRLVVLNCSRVSWAERRSSQFKSVCVPTLLHGHRVWVVTERMRVWIQVAFKGCLGLNPRDR